MNRIAMPLDFGQKVALVRSLAGYCRPGEWTRRKAIDVECGILSAGYDVADFEPAIRAFLFGYSAA